MSSASPSTHVRGEGDAFEGCAVITTGLGIDDMDEATARIDKATAKIDKATARIDKATARIDKATARIDEAASFRCW